MRSARLALAAGLALLLAVGCTGTPTPPATTPAPVPVSATTPTMTIPVTTATPTPTPTPTPSVYGAAPTATDAFTVPFAERFHPDAASPDRPTEALPHKLIPGMVDPPVGSGPERYLKQKYVWFQCAQGNQCARLKVPMDWANPDGQAITILIGRRVGSSAPLGAIFFNPGGPGGAGTEYLKSSKFNQLSAFDIITWDPRGTGKSTPVVCYDDARSELAALDALNVVDASPDDEAEYEALVAARVAFATSCADHTGDYLNYVNTQQTVRDLDFIRAILGLEKLHLYGVSYGSWLGAVYASTFPERVGRMVVTGAARLEPDAGSGQARGFDLALDSFSVWAAGRGRLGRTPEEVRAKITAFVDGLDAAPLEVDGRQLTQSLAVSGLVAYLYWNETYWTDLEHALVGAFARHGRELLELADDMNKRVPTGYDQAALAFPAIMCADIPDRGLAAAKALWPADIAAAPFFGKHFGPGVQCETWAVHARPPVVGAPTAPRILVVATTGDPATPYGDGAWMVNALGNAQLLTRDGPGHLGFGSGNSCIDEHLIAFWETGKLPPEGAVCKD